LWQVEGPHYFLLYKAELVHKGHHTPYSPYKHSRVDAEYLTILICKVGVVNRSLLLFAEHIGVEVLLRLLKDV
jgi:hypothetical protein